MRLLISGGGTGGHVYPALTVAAAMSKRADRLADRAGKVSFLYVGRARSVEERLAQHAQIPFEAIESGQVRGVAPWVAARSLWRMSRSVGRVRTMIRHFKPAVIFATGGYVSVPVIWAGAAERVPTVVYLPDLEPGWAIRATARWATRVAVSFAEAQKYFSPGKAIVTGYPVRESFFQSNKANARRRFHLDPDARTVALYGGSSGAHHINQAAMAHLVELTQLAQVVCFTGQNDEAWVSDQVAHLSGDLRARVRVFGYLDDDLPYALATADLVVARAGAAVLGEFPALGLPAILVPGPYAGLHQERNADFLVERGAALKVNDAALATDLIPTLKKLLDAPNALQTMRDAMCALAQPNAADNIAQVIEALAGASG
jgi:UDP-N-acetylglucosamine--N-acetylmuramyl-(pentapeptide) pyrophosphoryl-undecaprenol N-acetylglucosamine transferase